MLQKFLKNSLTYSIGHALTSSIAIFLLPIYTRYLSPAEYGVIDIFMVIAAIINVTIALEISQGISRYYQDGKNEREKREYTSSAFWFTVFVYLLFLFLSFVFSDFFTFWLLEDVSKKNIFLLAVFAIATNGIFHFTRNQLRWQMQPKNSVMTSLVNAVVTASLCIYLILVQELKVESIFIGQIAGNITASLVAILYVRKSYGFTFCTTKFKKMVSYSLPLVLSSIGIFIALYIDRIAIKNLLGLDELGIYGVGYRFAAVAFLIMAGFQQSLAPLIFKHYKEKKTPSDISKIFNIFIIFALFVIVGSVLFSKELVTLFTTKAYYSSESLIAILVMAILLSNMYIFAPGIIIAKKTKLFTMINISGAIINIILNYTLIPILGLSGAAYATLISAVCTFLLFIIFSNRHYLIPYQTKPILLSLAIALISSYGVASMFDKIEFTSIIAKIICLLIVFISASFFLLEKKYLQKIKLRLKMREK